jgi:hypothetical protein
MPPLRDVVVIEISKRHGRPSDGMDAIGDGINGVVGEHATGDVTVAHGDAIDIA